MDKVRKFKEWMNENMPALTVIYDNKYVGMVYDRFASLHPKQQKQLILGIFATIVALVVGYLGASYLSLWRINGQTDQSQEIIALLQKHQIEQRNQSASIAVLERSQNLNNPGQLKQMIQQASQTSDISPRMIKIDENPNAQPQGEDSKGEILIRQATVTLERVNLSQLLSFMEKIEMANLNLAISSVKIKNDDKHRGYMGVEFGIVAYIFKMEQG